MRIRIGEEVREQLEYVPASLIVLQHVRPKYACKCCEGNIVIAERLPEPIEKGLPGPGLLAQVVVSKYADHLPLYRQEGIFRRHGVELPRQTTCDWMAVCADLLEPICKAMHRRVLESRVIQTDDTPVKRAGPEHWAMITARLWVYLGDRAHPYIVYDFTEIAAATGRGGCSRATRATSRPMRIRATTPLRRRQDLEVGCMDARAAEVLRGQDDRPAAGARGAWRGSAGCTRSRRRPRRRDTERGAAARYCARRSRGRSWTKLKAWLDHEDQQRVLPKSPIGEAIGYALNHWAALERYLEAGILEIDNGASERAMKPVALGRKNWLFAGSAAGGRTAAILMSLCTTCKNLGRRPAGLPARRAGPGQHPPQQPDRGTAAGPLAGDPRGDREGRGRAARRIGPLRPRTRPCEVAPLRRGRGLRTSPK